MPAEVASAMLTEPKVRLTNRMRKNCKAALVRYVVSGPVPLVRVEGRRITISPGTALRVYSSEEARDLDCRDLRPKEGHVVKTPESKHAARLRSTSITQLHNWLRRTEARRFHCQEKYQEALAKLEAIKATTPEPPETADRAAIQKMAMFIQSLSFLAANYDRIADGLLTELERRERRREIVATWVPGGCFSKSVKHARIAALP